MLVVKSSQNTDIPSCVAVLGSFDGVHIGHAYLIARAKERALELSLPLLIYTFSRHPRHLIPGESVSEITFDFEKTDSFASLGADIVYFEDFEKIMDFTPERFVSETLIGKIHAAQIYCGANFTFGKSKSGDPQRLTQLCKTYGVEANVIEQKTFDGMTVSSSRIRREIVAGNMSYAAKLLGRPYSICFPVEHGRHLGEKIGFPTINQRFPSGKLIPGYGVYICRAEIDGREYPAVSDVGIKPTVNEKSDAEPLCETHIIGYTGDLYGISVRIDFYEKLRDEKKFPSLDELIEEIRKDVKETEEYFNK